MKLLSFLLVIAVTATMRAEEPKADQPLTPEAAIKRVNEKVVVEMMVKGSKNRAVRRSPSLAC